MLPLGIYNEDWGPSAKKIKTIHSSLIRVYDEDNEDHLRGELNESSKEVFLKRLHNFTLDGKFVDITLKMDDGAEFPCHRNVLAANSDYFLHMFSNDMSETNKKIVKIAEVPSPIMKIALDYMYLLRCTFAYSQFFDLLIVANMFEIKGLEQCLGESFAEDCEAMGAYYHSKMSIDFLVQFWRFSQDYPILTESIRVSGTSLQQIISRTFKYPSNIGALKESNILKDFDVESLKKLLADTEMSENSSSYLDIVIYWMKHCGEDAAADLRTAHFDDDLTQSTIKLSLSQIDLIRCHVDWKDSKIKPHYEAFVKSRDVDQNRFLILPHHSNRNQFIAHCMASGKTFVLNTPKLEGDPYGTSQLAVHMEGDSHELYSFQGQHVSRDINDNSLRPSLCCHRYSFSKKQWILLSEEHLYRFEKCKNLDFCIPPTTVGPYKISIGLVGRSNRLTETIFEIDDSSLPYVNFFRLHKFLDRYPGRSSLRSDWASCVLELEVAAICETEKDKSVLLGNSNKDESGKKPVSMYGVIGCELQPFPDGLVDVPLNVISIENVMFVCASAPFLVSKESSKPYLKLPQVWMFKPYFGSDKREQSKRQWTPLPTPSFPDISFATFYFDPFEKKLNLVMMQEGMKSQRGRLVGRFTLKGNIEELYNRCFEASKPWIHRKGTMPTLDETWTYQPVSEATADFLSCGCSLPGQVRLLFARLNSVHMQQVTLEPDAEGVMKVKFEGTCLNTHENQRSDSISKMSTDEEVVSTLTEIVERAVEATNSIHSENEPERMAIDQTVEAAPRWMVYQDSSFKGEMTKTLELQMQNDNLDGIIVNKRKLQLPLA